MAGSFSGAYLVFRSQINYIDALLIGTRWQSSLITYSFPDSLDDYQPGYASSWDTNGDGEFLAQETNYIFREDQRLAAHMALESSSGGAMSIEGFTELDIRFDGFGSGTGTIRFLNSSDQDRLRNGEILGSAQVIDFPGGPTTSPIFGGDILFSNRMLAREYSPGTYGYQTVFHEIGHAVGLKHPHKDQGIGFINDPLNFYDGLEYTTMSYKGFPGKPSTGEYSTEGSYPQTFMMLDILALQYLYGPNYTANAGDTYYQWDQSGNSFQNGIPVLGSATERVIFQTIWDGNGNDTYDLSNFGGGVRVDLSPGSSSVVSTAQLALLGSGSATSGQIFAQGNIYNALQWGGDQRSLIENAYGGSGNDLVYGNAAQNYLSARQGDDFIYGYGGADSLLGGEGNDFIDGGSGADLLFGGVGSDRFYFDSMDDSPVNAQDIIRGFGDIGRIKGDVLDFSGIDANPGTAADDAFRFGITGLGAIALYELAGGNTVCALSDDTDIEWEFALTIEDGLVMAGNYSLDEFVL